MVNHHLLRAGHLKMASTLLLPTLLLAGLAQAAVVDVLPGDPSIRYLGRWGTDKYSNDIQWSWSASGASITFSGTACSIRLKAQGSMYNILVDGKATGVLDLSNSTDTLFTLATGLSQGHHTVAVRLRTEANYSQARFRGFRIDGTPGIAPAANPRRIEFYGNSITCGYGILDSVASSPFQIKTENEAVTFAAQAADSLGAERHVVCWSGRGVIQNYGGDTKSATVPRMYRQVLTSDTSVAWDFTRWIPQVVVIDLGTNDYSTASAQPDSAKFFRTYRDFVDTLHARYPNAQFVLVDGPMMSDGYPAGLNTLSKIKKHLDNVVADVTKRGIKATHLSLTPQGNMGYGADYHPNLAQAKLNGQELTAHLRSVVDWGASSILTGSVMSARATLVKEGRFLSVRIPEGTVAQAKIVDSRGRATWSQKLSTRSTVLPASEASRWLVVESTTGRQVLPMQVELR